MRRWAATLGMPKTGGRKNAAKKEDNPVLMFLIGIFIMSYDTFIKKALAVHGTIYNYSLVEYRNSRTKVKIVCSKHGIFEQIPNSHLLGHGCRKCAIALPVWNKSNSLDFIDKAMSVHGNKYDYSLIVYVESSKKVKIVCPKHGVFEQTPNEHLQGSGCLKCAIEYRANKSRSNTSEFVEKARKVHGNKYDYSIVNYVEATKKVQILCPAHGMFSQQPSAHLSGAGCPSCLESHGEQRVAILLNGFEIEYERQRSFKQCRNKRPLFFDFYIPCMNTCIEYDGQQHYFPCEFFGGVKKFEELKRTDFIKTEFCLKNEIKLIRVSYEKSPSEVKDFLKKELLQPNMQV